jgi:undecaprenyl diphosphate synthase
MSLRDKIDIDSLPEHVAIIMDGNGRWARQRGKPRTFGHKHGVTSVRETTEAAAELGVKYLTLYAFSTENWNRPRIEIDALMHLLLQSIKGETKNLNKNNIKLRTIGDIGSLPVSIQKKLNKACASTDGNTQMTLTLALSYSARSEIVEASRSIAASVNRGEIALDDIDVDMFKSALSTADIPDPELLIRTSDEYRISNFLLWQIAYAELYFTPTLWPDFRKEDLYQAILDYQQRERRFGKTSDQIKKKG